MKAGPAPGYLSGGGTFPQPLNEAEERDLLLRKEGGDPDARNLLVEHNLRLVAHVVKKFDNTGEDLDDLISIGTVGLIKAIQTYDRSKGTRLATYAARCIENEILMYLRSLRKVRGEVSLYEPIGVDKEGNEIALIDVLGTDPDVVPDQVGLRFDQGRLRAVLARLRPRERRVLELRYGLLGGDGSTQREIARLLGISRSYVSRIEKCAAGSTTAGLPTTPASPGQRPRPSPPAQAGQVAMAATASAAARTSAARAAGDRGGRRRAASRFSYTKPHASSPEAPGFDGGAVGWVPWRDESRRGQPARAYNPRGTPAGGWPVVAARTRGRRRAGKPLRVMLVGAGDAGECLRAMGAGLAVLLSRPAGASAPAPLTGEPAPATPPGSVAPEQEPAHEEPLSGPPRTGSRP